VSEETRPRQWSATTAFALIFFIALGIVLIFSPILYPHAGAGSGAAHPAPAIETFAALLVMTFSIFAIVWGARRPTRERIGEIVAYAVVFAVGAVALWGLPQWSGFVAVGALVALIFAPNWLVALARRQAMAGWRRRAAVAWRVASWLHPSRAMRFYAALVRAGALPSTDAEVAAYAAMKRGATPYEMRILDCATASARDDWTGVLDHSHEVPELKAYEIRALAELGRVDEMIAAVATVSPRPPGRELDLCRLNALAFAGRVDGVRTVLQGRLRFLRPEVAAYWSFIAATAAGLSNDTRSALAAYARHSDDESFRRAAQRHLTAAVPSASPVLSPASIAAIAEIEAAVGRPAR
jgi:hypothetical protein